MSRKQQNTNQPLFVALSRTHPLRCIGLRRGNATFNIDTCVFCGQRQSAAL